MHFRKALNSDHLAADDFVDAKTMEPVVRTLTIDDLIDLLVGHLRKHRQAQDAFDDVLGSR